MDRNQATYEAYDGVVLTLLNDRTVQVPALTVEEATRLLRLSAAVEEGEPADVEGFIGSFPARSGLLGERLEDLRVIRVGARPPRALAVDEPWADRLKFGNLTLEDGLEIARLYLQATGGAWIAAAARAQIRILEELPSTFGLEAPTRAETLECARAFAHALYRHIYGLAQDFCEHPVPGPTTAVTRARARRSSSTPVSTT